MRSRTSFAVAALSFLLAACYLTDGPVIRSGEEVGFARQYTCVSRPGHEPELWRIELQHAGPHGHEYVMRSEKVKDEAFSFRARALDNGFLLMQIRLDEARTVGPGFRQGVFRTHAGGRPFYFYVQRRASGSLLVWFPDFLEPAAREAATALAARSGVAVGGVSERGVLGLVSGGAEAVRQFLEHPALRSLAAPMDCYEGDLRVPPAGAAAPVLSKLEAVQQIQRLFSGKHGVRLPLGEHRFTEAELAEGGSKHEFAETVAALEDIGVVKVADLPTMLGQAHFRVESNEGLDEAELGDWGGVRYLRYAFTSDDVEIVRIDAVKGGTTQWDGAVVHANLTIDSPTELYMRYLERRRKPLARERRVRILFRFDPSRQVWSWMVFDQAPRDRDFASDGVPRKLRETD